MTAAAGRRPLRLLVLALSALVLTVLTVAGATLTAGSASAATPVQGAPSTTVHATVATVLPAQPGDPLAPGDPAAPGDPIAPVDPVAPAPGVVTVDLDGTTTAPSSSIVVLLGITLLSVAPSLLLMMTSFTKIFVVLALTRNALGLTGVPPNQVLAGLALFLSLFIMAPIISQVNELGVQPYVNGGLDFGAAVEAGSAPLREFMLGQTREEDIALMTRAADQPNPTDAASVPMLTLIPSFMLSELRAAFIIGFVIFIPFLVIDLVVSSALMSMGMMMLPPVMISLPFKILLFVLIDGWGMIITALVGSYG